MQNNKKNLLAHYNIFWGELSFNFFFFCQILCLKTFSCRNIYFTVFRFCAFICNVHLKVDLWYSACIFDFILPFLTNYLFLTKQNGQKIWKILEMKQVTRAEFQKVETLDFFSAINILYENKLYFTKAMYIVFFLCWMWSVHLKMSKIILYRGQQSFKMFTLPNKKPFKKLGFQWMKLLSSCGFETKTESHWISRDLQVTTHPLACSITGGGAIKDTSAA